MSSLILFSQPEILRKIGARRLHKVLAPFTAELQAVNFPIPLPHEPGENGYFDNLAQALATTPLPGPALKVLLQLEAAVSPEKNNALENIISRRLTHVSLPPDCPLDRALEVFFLCPEEFASLHAPAAPSVAPAPATSPVPAAPQPVPEVCAPPSGNGHPETSPPAQTQPSPQNGSIPSNGASSPPGWELEVIPWPEPVTARVILDALLAVLLRFVVLPKWAAETLALWILHTYVYEHRDVSTYLGIESPIRRCGKTTLLTILSRLVNRPVVAANVSSPAFFRAIEELRPTLMIDEADTFLKGNDQLQGIINAGYTRPTAYVLRVNTQAVDPEAKNPNSALAFFSCWCPKAIARIGRLPDTLADRCILIRMQRKTTKEKCERLRNLHALELRQQCARFARDFGQAVADAKPESPPDLNDRAADIWEPLFALADLAGGPWPQRARDAALGLSAATSENNPISSLLLDIFCLFNIIKADRLPTRELVEGLNTRFANRPWMEARNGKPITDMWLAKQLRPFGISSRCIRLGQQVAKGYVLEDFHDAFRRYISKSDLDALVSEATPQPEPPKPPPHRHQGRSSSEPLAHCR